MTFKISKVTEPVSYDSLPVAKVASYPLETRDYRPFAQNILCVSDTYLHLRMWAFEVNPSPASRLECALYLFSDSPDTALVVVAAPAGDSVDDLLGFCLLQNGHELPIPPEIEEKLCEIAPHPHNGEDLQGVYWGYTVDIPLSLLERWGGNTLLEPGQTFPGNFYKICVDEPFVHLGSFAPADFEGNPYLLDSMGDFTVVSY